MPKPAIAFDIDDVLMPHFGDLIAWYNHEYGTKLTMFDNHATNPRNWGTDDVGDAIRRVHGFFETQQFLNSLPFVGAVNVLTHLHKQYELIVVTARDMFLEPGTRDWLDKHFEGLFSETYFTARYSLDGGRRDKLDVLKASGVSYFVDDSYENVLPAVRSGVHGVIFGDYEWNRIEKVPEALVGNLTRCNNWTEIGDYFEQQA